MSFQARARIVSRRLSGRRCASSRRASRQCQPLGDARQPVAGDPAHRRRIGVDAHAAAIFPDAGVGRQRQFQRHLAERLQPLEQRDVALLRQPLVEEHLRGGEDHAAVDVVLYLRDGGVADPHRPLPAIAGERVDDALLEIAFRQHAVDRLQRRLALERDHVGDIFDEMLHGAAGADAVERLNREMRVADPADSGSPSCVRNPAIPGSRSSAPRRWRRSRRRSTDAA